MQTRGQHCRELPQPPTTGPQGIGPKITNDFKEACMPHYSSLREYTFAGANADDIRGSTVYGLGDEKLGKIDDVIFDHTTGDIGYVIVDTGGWLKSKKFLVPAERLSQLTSTHEGDFYVPLTKNQIESFPPYE